jgi:arabinofuranosyltransferase
MLAGIARNRFVGLGIVGGALTLAFLARFVQDDAFISFRYAQNLANGHGLVFNVGERVEGYSNFLWTLLMAIPHVLGADPIRFAYVVGLTCFVGTLVATRALALAVTGRDNDALLTVALLATNFTFLCYATGGLETQLQTFLLATAAWLALDARLATSVARVVGLSLIAGLALLTRLDSVLVLLPLYVVVLARAVHVRRDGAARPLAWLAAAFVPGGVLVAGWMAWKLAYYGELLPNTLLV